MDAPQAAVTGAQTLVSAVMEDRGYPTQPYDQTVADLSVEHASTLDHFRAAHDISQKAASGAASTEDLRQAMIHYRALFAELLGEPAARLEATEVASSVTATQPDGLPPVDQPVAGPRACLPGGRALSRRPSLPRSTGLPRPDQPAAPAWPGTAGETPGEPACPDRNPTPDAVTTARRQER